MKRNIADWLTMVVTFFCTVAALGVVGGFQLGHMDFVGFFIGEGICIALIALLAAINHVFGSRRKRPLRAVTKRHPFPAVLQRFARRKKRDNAGEPFLHSNEGT